MQQRKADAGRRDRDTGRGSRAAGQRRVVAHAVGILWSGYSAAECQSVSSCHLHRSWALDETSDLAHPPPPPPLLQRLRSEISRGKKEADKLKEEIARLDAGSQVSGQCMGGRCWGGKGVGVEVLRPAFLPACPPALPASPHAACPPAPSCLAPAVQEAEGKLGELGGRIARIADFSSDLTKLRTQHEMQARQNAEAIVRLRVSRREDGGACSVAGRVVCGRAGAL